MKTFWSWAAKILLVVALVEAWYIYDLHNKNEALIADNVNLETQLAQSEQALATVRSEIEELEKRSLEGVLKETNKAVISGWEKLLNTVEKELEKARDAIPGIIGSDPGADESPLDKNSTNENRSQDSTTESAQEPSAGKEPSADKKSSADKEPSADEATPPATESGEPIQGERT